MTEILVTGEAKQPAATAKPKSQLKIGDIGAPVGVEPVLLLGEVVVGNPGAMEFSQGGFGGPEIGGVAVRFGDVQRHATDPAAH